MYVVWNLGLVEYGKAYELQKAFHRRRLNEEIPDTLLLLEHPPTVTVGKSGNVRNIVASKEELIRLGISMFFTDRGGDATYHGPGQLVGYPIVNLKHREKDIRKFVHDIEEVIMQTMRDFSITTERDETHPGVWVDKQELAAIGLSVRRWVSMHGFALNINPRLKDFEVINPCGFEDRKATSMSRILGYAVPMEEVSKVLVMHFSDVFGSPIIDNASFIEELNGRQL